jgi:hypothetical protein
MANESKITLNEDFEVELSDLEKIAFNQINIGDVIKVTTTDHSDYRHIHGLRLSFNNPKKDFAHGFWYGHNGSGGCVIPAKDKDLVLERVEPNTAFRLLKYYQKNWAHPDIPPELDPRKNY